jgi:hypothetical protein
VGVAYGPRPMPGIEEFSEAVKKMKFDIAMKNLSKHMRAAGKKKMMTVKAAPSRGKASLKRSSDADVASARPR